MAKSERLFQKIFPNTMEQEVTILASNPFNSGEYFAINNRGIFGSTDFGISWAMFDIPWPKEYLLQYFSALTDGIT